MHLIDLNYIWYIRYDYNLLYNYLKNIPKNLKINNLNETLVHWASKKNMLILIKLLNKLNYSINIQNKNGSTPLHIAVLNMFPYIVKILLKNGANIYIKDNKKFNSLYYCNYNINHFNNFKDLNKILEIKNYIDNYKEKKINLNTKIQWVLYNKCGFYILNNF